jgi:thioester reductase-like protein
VAIRASGQRADSVLHVASLIPFLGVPDAAVFRINVDGTANVVRACEQAGVPALMYTSSATVALDRDVVHARKLTEESPPPRTHLDTYTTTKAAAEKIVVDANGSGVTTCVLRPAAIFGRGDKCVSVSLPLCLSTACLPVVDCRCALLCITAHRRVCVCACCRAVLVSCAVYIHRWRAHAALVIVAVCVGGT